MQKDKECYLLRPNRDRWNRQLAEEVDQLLSADPGNVFDKLGRVFEATLIERALFAAGGCRYKAAGLLGIGRNTIARKIELLEIGDRHSRAHDFTPLGLKDFFRSGAPFPARDDEP